MQNGNGSQTNSPCWKAESHERGGKAAMTTDAKKLSDRKERTDFETEMRALAADDYRTAYIANIILRANILRELLESQQK